MNTTSLSSRALDISRLVAQGRRSRLELELLAFHLVGLLGPAQRKPNPDFDDQLPAPASISNDLHLTSDDELDNGWKPAVELHGRPPARSHGMRR